MSRGFMAKSYNLCGLLLNILEHKNLKWRSPTEIGLGYTPDASHFQFFSFFQNIFTWILIIAVFLIPKRNQDVGLDVHKSAEMS